MSDPDRITTVISDFGGVLTTPLIQSFAAVQDETGVQFEELGDAMTRIQEEDGRHPLFELETGRLSETDFLRKLGDALELVLEWLSPPRLMELCREAMELYMWDRGGSDN